MKCTLTPYLTTAFVRRVAVGGRAKSREHQPLNVIKYILTILAVLAPLLAHSQLGTIATICGNRSPTHSGDGGPATAATICTNAYGAIDKFGNYYFAERFCHRVRVISASGIINTVAGTGIAGFSGDSGQATAARINDPIGVAIDSRGDLYIGEMRGSKIRKVDMATGVITTIAGTGRTADSCFAGPATASSFGGANDLCFDIYYNLYFSDGYGKIRKIHHATSIITTYAGRTTSGGFSGDGGPATNAEFNQPSGIFVDSSGNLYVADWANARVRKIEHSTGIITTVAGNGTGTFNGDGLPALSSQLHPFDVIYKFGILLIADEYNSRIRALDSSTILQTIAGSDSSGFNGDGGTPTAARLNHPEGIVQDECGNLFIADCFNYRIRKITYPYGNQPCITITAQGGNTLCYPMPTTFTAHTTLAGSAPVHQWRVNGAPVGTSAPTYTYTPANGDSIDCILTSNLYCVVNPRDTSNVLRLSVFSLAPLALALSGAASVVLGDTAVVTASITGTGMGAYTIIWYKNGVWLDTTSTPTLRYIKPAGDDTITTVLVSYSRNCYDSVVAAGHVVRANVGVMESGSGGAESGIILWPNPLNGTMHIGGLSPVGSTITLYDLLGRELLRSEVASSTGEVNLSGLVSGVYVVQVCDMGSGVRVVRRVRVE